MNRVIDRYLASTVIATVSVVLVLVVSLDMLFSFIDELADLSDTYSAWDALLYVVMSLPRRFYEFVSMSVLLGCLIGLGGLASHSELTVMRTAGLSIARIGWGAIKPALVFVLVAVLLGEYVVPYTENYAQSHRALAQSGDEALKSRYGYWHREGDEYVHFNAVLPGGVLYGVTRYQFDDNKQLTRTSYASKAIYQDKYWVLEQVDNTRLTPEETLQESQTTERWDTSLTPEVLKVVVVEPEDLSIQGLWTYSRYLVQQGLEAQKYQLAFWKKMLQPLATVIMVLVALSCIFGPMRSVAMGSRIFFGIILGLTFKYAEDFLGPASIVFGFAPLLASLIPMAIYLLLAIVLLKRAG